MKVACECLTSRAFMAILLTPRLGRAWQSNAHSGFKSATKGGRQTEGGLP